MLLHSTVVGALIFQLHMLVSSPGVTDWCNQFFYLMFDLLIVKLFEKCVFFFRTGLMVWENGPT